MAIYIEGMKMPKDGEHPIWIALRSDGTVDYNANKGDGWQMTTAVSIPSHGRLIDADALVDKHFSKEYLSKAMTASKEEMSTALVNVPIVINNAPTIIPEEEEGHA